MTEKPHERSEVAEKNTQQIASDEIGQLHPHSAPSGFLNLPYEIRRLVYSFLIPRKRVIRVTRSMFACGVEPLDNDYDFNPNRSRFNVLRLSRKISEETLDILYGENLFQVSLNGDGEGDLEHNFTERNRRRIRFVLVLMTAGGVSSTPKHPFVGLTSSEPKSVPDNCRAAGGSKSILERSYP
ncbi:hypothetical protein PENARI_c039G01610 [Penicillium arizonense]|uniref:F-box domain-containing protein n=1 Tax=Penicillium arizonense TaxID=1835702 RepID=A0A1F5L353_PENAI|nr:hypothetical protein PENARI_c039G01610 [Penicillium arizonense]OGE47663.1 hypothetical protein PENARI_c039G01610 [Penicillium arizonense]